MSSSVEGEGAERARIMLGLLESVERDGAKSQRRLASELGIALGLVNAYLKRCVKKGLVKVSEAPARRYAYYLTPQGFIEKSRLTVDYLAHSFSFFRRARADCGRIFADIQARGQRRVVLAGISDLAEIATLCALECGVEIVAVMQPGAERGMFLGIPVVGSFDLVGKPFDAVVVTDLQRAQDISQTAAAILGPELVFVPDLLRVRFEGKEPS